jgi:N-acetylneuraminate synthase
LEFGKEEYDEIDRYCRQVNIDWFASAWDVPSQHFIRQYDLKYNKIASAMLTHEALLQAVAEEGRLTFISTGMSTFGEIDKAVNIFKAYDCPFVLMHTVSEYPAAESTLNLRMISVLRERYNCLVGYSGHEVTMFPSVIAAAMGAVAIERHISLDRAMYGSDQAASLEKRGLELMVGGVQTITIVLGNGEKTISKAEEINMKKLRYWGTYK